MMPHPERMAEAAHGGTDGAAMFESLVAQVVAA
jgi:phosphoribosylformylglycinamidine synthase